eukprot:GILI01014411.1.p1 GENE.GILI01014411.1~~GILI01014411.1.p1  ORF type:complete len:626 (+),score=157.99 GILI01014411.1:79-1956(+)
MEAGSLTKQWVPSLLCLLVFQICFSAALRIENGPTPSPGTLESSEKSGAAFDKTQAFAYQLGCPGMLLQRHTVCLPRNKDDPMEPSDGLVVMIANNNLAVADSSSSSQPVRPTLLAVVPYDADAHNALAGDAAAYRKSGEVCQKPALGVAKGTVKYQWAPEGLASEQKHVHALQELRKMDLAAGRYLLLRCVASTGDLACFDWQPFEVFPAGSAPCKTLASSELVSVQVHSVSGLKLVEATPTPQLSGFIRVGTGWALHRTAFERQLYHMTDAHHPPGQFVPFNFEPFVYPLGPPEVQEETLGFEVHIYQKTEKGEFEVGLVHVQLDQPLSSKADAPGDLLAGAHSLEKQFWLLRGDKVQQSGWAVGRSGYVDNPDVTDRPAPAGATGKISLTVKRIKNALDRTIIFSFSKIQVNDLKTLAEPAKLVYTTFLVDSAAQCLVETPSKPDPVWLDQPYRLFYTLPDTNEMVLSRSHVAASILMDQNKDDDVQDYEIPNILGSMRVPLVSILFSPGRSFSVSGQNLNKLGRNPVGKIHFTVSTSFVSLGELPSSAVKRTLSDDSVNAVDPSPVPSPSPNGVLPTGDPRAAGTSVALDLEMHPLEKEAYHWKLHRRLPSLRNIRVPNPN